jgi:hypothetical protein
MLCLDYIMLLFSCVPILHRICVDCVEIYICSMSYLTDRPHFVVESVVSVLGVCKHLWLCISMKLMVCNKECQGDCGWRLECVG